MFDLNKSLAKLKSFLEDNDLKKDSKKVNEESFNISNKDKNSQQKLKKIQKSSNIKDQPSADKSEHDKRGVIVIKNFPHGFYEKQMFDYFSQFGEITRLKIIRSRKTGKPRNIGFIEFRFQDVAQIVAETMNNYLMFDHIIKCNLLPREKIRSNIFKNWYRPFVSSVEKHKTFHNQSKTREQELRMVHKHLKRLHKMENILRQKQIEFKCVVVNRPIDLSKTNNSRSISKPNQLQECPSYSSMPEEIIRMTHPKTKLSTLINKKRMVVPRFMKLKAGLRI